MQFCFSCLLKKGHVMEDRSESLSITLSIRLTWLSRQVATTDRSVDLISSLTLSSSSLATAVQTGVTASAPDSDPAGFAACLGLAGVIFGALLTGACAVYHPQDHAQRTQQSQEEQFVTNRR